MSLTASDFYGSTPPGRKKGDTAPTSGERASGAEVASVMEKAPAFAWLGLVLFLVALRVAWELAE